MKNKRLISTALLTMLLSSCGDISGYWKVYTITNEIKTTTPFASVKPFDTLMSVYCFFEDDEKNVDETYEQVKKISNDNFVRLHKFFDRKYDYYESEENKTLVTNVHTINNSYGTGTPVACSSELYDLLKLSVEGYKLTNGYFNIFTGALTDYWEDILTSEKKIDEDDPYYVEAKKVELENILKTVPQIYEDVQKMLIFNDETKEVTFNDIYDLKTNTTLKKPLLSVGGIAKGYATDIVKQIYKDNDFNRIFINSGSSSITTTSKPVYTKEKGGQQISILDPSKYYEDGIAFSFKNTKEFSFSTSGNYTAGKSYQFKDNDGNIIYRHHIINPKTGYPESLHSSISVLSNSFSNAYLDIFSTALMNLPTKEGFEFIKVIRNKFPKYDIDIFYIDQIGDTIKVIASSDVNKTLEVTQGVELVYEK